MNSDQSELAKLFDEYGKNLQVKLVELDALWKVLEQSWHLQTLQEFHRLLHSLHGSAGAYGYQKISKIAGEIEALIMPILNEADPSKEMKQKISDCLSELKQSSKISKKDLAALSERFNHLSKSYDKIIFLLDRDSEWSNKFIAQLKAFGYEVKNFTEINVLNRALSEHRPLALLIDIQVLDGIKESTLTQLNELAKAQHIPLLFSSTNSDFFLRLKAVRLGGIAFLVKPFAMEEITIELDHLLVEAENGYRILIVDDDADVINYYSVMLRQAHMMVQATTKAIEVEGILHEFKPDLVLVDVHMPECNGWELTLIIHQQKTHEHIPIIFLSSEQDKRKQLEAMRAGADDFIPKNVNIEYLITTIKNRIKRYQMLRNLMIKDSLTNTFTHDYILQECQVELRRAKIKAQSLCVVMIDLDNFKWINHQFGYLMGDQLIKSLCFMLRSRLREGAIIGRYSGKKFLLVLPDKDLELTRNLLDDIRQDFTSITYQEKEQLFAASFCAGVASYPPYGTLADLLKAADDALIFAKQQGGNKIEIAKESTTASNP